MTKLLYTMLKCEVLPDVGKALLPGASDPSAIKVRKRDEIHLKLPDGRWLKTVAENYRAIEWIESVARHLNVVPGSYEVVVVPDEFLAVGLENGAEVYLVKPRQVAIRDSLERIKWDSESDGIIALPLNPSDANELRKLSGMEAKSKEFVKKGAEVYAKA